MRKTLYWVLIGIFSLIFLISAYVVVDYMITSRESQDYWGEISNEFHGNGTQGKPTVQPPVTTVRPGTQEPSNPVGSTGAPLPTTEPSDETQPTLPSEPTQPPVTVPPEPTQPPQPPQPTLPPEPTQPLEVLSNFKTLLKRNKDVVGYISIEIQPEFRNKSYIGGLKYLLDYPILHHPQEKDYYLRRNLDRVYDADGPGSIYLREQCDMFEPTDVMTIYGHAMADGSMFGMLNRYYLYKEFFDAHQYIQVWDLYAQHTYQVVCVFKTSGTYGVGFPYHLFDDFTDEAEYNEFINGVRDLAKYDTGIETQYGDKFICLSTCEYTMNNGRLVVVAKRIS